ncbi:MAG: hypothetical protein IJ846_05920, partial [Alphaproteobacteria bacterium]|nr:hypothetical protein [Alphaproteobacteria bacterium]
FSDIKNPHSSGFVKLCGFLQFGSHIAAAEKVTQDVFFQPCSGSGQRPRKMRALSVASFIIIALPLARETHVYPGKIF